MKVRTRLVASFAYVLLVVIVALTVPLAIVLRDRARSELEALTLTNAQTVAAVLNQDRLDDDPAERRRLEGDAARYAADVGGRVVILDTDGTVLVDSGGEDVGENFATAGRPEVAQALDSQAVADVRRSDEEGGDIAVGAAPIIDEGELVGAVRISRGVQTVQENVGRATAAIVAVALGGLVAGLVLAVALARSIARPMTRLATTARTFGEGDLSSRAGPIEGDAEVKELAHSFDEMAERTERTVRSQREFVANASHQLRTPLTGIKLRLEGAIADTTDPRIREELRAADQEVDRLAQIIERLLTMATRIEEGSVPRADVGDAVDRTVAAVERAGGAGVVDALGAGPRGRVGGGRPRRRRSGPRRPDRQRAQVRARSDRGARDGARRPGGGLGGRPRSRDPPGRGFQGHGALLPRPRRAHGRIRARARDRAGARRAVGRRIVGGRRPERCQDRCVVPAGRRRPGLAEP